MNRPEWHYDSACRELKPGVFFSDRPGRGANDAAKAVCATCTVVVDCLVYALENTIKHGVWGGLDERQRRVLRRQIRGGGDVRRVAESVVTIAKAS